MFYEPIQDVQRPTHFRLHVRDTNDAHTVFEAVRQGLLKPVQRRLNDFERAMYIKSGTVFVWEESEEEMGLKRWTDGRVWSQSRMREPYLFYDEKVASDENQGVNDQSSRCVYRFVDGPSRTWSSSAQSHYDRSDHHPKGLVKQAYSAWVLTSVDTKPRKWHLTAYFTYSDLPNVPTVDRDPMLRNLTVPAGVYKSGKSRSKNANADAALAFPSRLSFPSPPSSLHTGPSSRLEDSLVLPALNPIVGVTQFSVHGATRRTLPRAAEDQRMIEMLNARSIL
ncbi:hypothetical protein AcW1_006110 [Taiwanofungus camphoratus]|nr:hypothetical protein AcW2_004872 [Antrodia cinnamomea]KAI0934661.1 hypothetical protein AcV5_006430 [Antrodia cinnamomea]KAI0950053.1 hypothetical protein AcV7_008637 [Antrodia cinnamomea]KAI0957855.1 hypothetical protein AcW1_006110 [Antrodia cinnamomea]